jgi:phosphate transport system permease protein
MATVTPDPIAVEVSGVPVARPVPSGPPRHAAPPDPPVAPPVSARPAGPERPRDLHSRTLDDVLSLAGSGIASLALVWLLYTRILPLQGVLGFVICWYLAFLALYAAVTTVLNPFPVVVDRLASAVIYGGAVTVGLALVSAVVFTYYRGWQPLLHPNTYVEAMAGVRPQDPLSRGGVVHAVVGSLIEVGIAIVITLPLGVGTAVFMTEVGGRLARIVRTVVEAMTALPSIVAGLFVYTVLIVTLHFPRSGFAAAMAITVMMLPIVARAADVVLRVVPGGLREAGLALGATHWRTVWHVVLPTARPGLATALILGVARGVGETSPVLLTSGASTFFNRDPVTGGTMNSLPLFIYTAVRSGQPTFIQRGFGAAAVLLGLVLVLFVMARRLARQKRNR